MNRLSLSALLCGILLLAPFPAHAMGKDDLRTVTVTGTGIATAPADTAEITIGVVSQDETASEALAENTEAMSEVIEQLKKEGVEGKDIQTSNFSVGPIYARQKGAEAPKITGYRVTNTVNITVRKIRSLGEVLDKVVASGSNQISGVRFSVDEPAKLLDEARKEAMKNAAEKAKLLAKAADASLGKALKIQENYGPQPRPMMTRVEARSRDVPIEPGEQTIRAQVTVTWQLN